AMEDCVRGRARNVPVRTPAQLRQLQFHWGKPRPAAEPTTRIFTDSSGWGTSSRAEQAAGARRPGSRPYSAPQRRAIYIVISIPKRKSVAFGVSQRIALLPGSIGWTESIDSSVSFPGEAARGK